jgi:hypothetical protein
MKIRALAAAALGISAAVVSAQRPAVGAAFDEFWSAKSPAEARRHADVIVRSGATFDDAYARLRRG